MQSGPEQSLLIQALASALTLPDVKARNAFIQQIAYRYIYDANVFPDGEKGPLSAAVLQEINAKTSIEWCLKKFEVVKQSILITNMCQTLNRKMTLAEKAPSDQETIKRPSITPSHRLTMEQRLAAPIVESTVKSNSVTSRRISPTVITPVPVRSKSETSAVESLLYLQHHVPHPKPFPSNKPPERPKMSDSPFSIKKI
jgi:hypothetical protein